MFTVYIYIRNFENGATILFNNNNNDKIHYPCSFPPKWISITKFYANNEILRKSATTTTIPHQFLFTRFVSWQKKKKERKKKGGEDSSSSNSRGGCIRQIFSWIDSTVGWTRETALDRYVLGRRSSNGRKRAEGDRAEHAGNPAQYGYHRLRWN